MNQGDSSKRLATEARARMLIDRQLTGEGHMAASFWATCDGSSPSVRCHDGDGAAAGVLAGHSIRTALRSAVYDE